MPERDLTQSCRSWLVLRASVQLRRTSPLNRYQRVTLTSFMALIFVAVAIGEPVAENLKAGMAFKDCSHCSETVAIPTGTYPTGASAHEDGSIRTWSP